MFSSDDLENLSRELEKAKIPPVECWNPPLSGDMDLCIKANGEWYHEGRRITRQSLIKLFSSILKKEDDDYFLVSPVEKWRIQVEDAPFLVIDVEVERGEMENEQRIIFKTTTDDIFFLDDEHPLRMIEQPDHSVRPYVIVRQGMTALINRRVFYVLSGMAVSYKKYMGVWSRGGFFVLEA